MSDNKTKPSNASVSDYLETVTPVRRREDSLVLLDLMQRVSGEKPVLWGGNIVGFGEYHYLYKSGRQGDWPRTGFAPRKASLSIYIMPGFEKCQKLLSKLGKHRTSVSCLYINKLADVDLAVLEDVVRFGWDEMARMYP